MDNLSERIKQARKRGKYTQDALADAIGVSSRAIKSYEKDASKISVSKVKKIAHLCGVNEIWLFTGTGEISNKSTSESSNKPIFYNDAIVAEHAKIIEQFDDKEAGKAINEDLIDIEKLNKETFMEVKGYIKGVANGLRATIEKLNQHGRVVGKHKGEKKTG